MSSQWVDFTAIKGSVDIEQVLEHYHVRLKHVRRDYLRGLCPLPTHGSKQSRESFSVDTGKNIWACHSTSCCQARHGKVGGNILDLVAWMEDCSIREAALRLRTWSGVSGEAGPPSQLVSKGERPGRSQEKLPRLPFTLRLQWHPYLEQRGIQWLTAAWFGVGYYGGSGFLRGRMVFPIHDNAANWWRMRDARWMAGSRAIYFRRDSTNRRWFIISIARSRPRPGKGVWGSSWKDSSTA